MEGCEKQLNNSSGTYHTPLDNLMDNLQISSEQNFKPSLCTNSLLRHFGPAGEDRFFRFCSTVEQLPKKDNVVKDNQSNNDQQQQQQQNEETCQTTSQNYTDTPKRSLVRIRKQRLFATPVEKLKPITTTSVNTKQFSPPAIGLLLKKAITQNACPQRGQEKIMKKRTSIRI